MKTPRIYFVLVMIVALFAHAEEGDDALELLLNKSACVILAKTDEVIVRNFDPTMMRYECFIKVIEVYKGDLKMTGASTNASVDLIERKINHLTVEGGKSYIFFLKRDVTTNGTFLESADRWFSVQPPNAELGDAIKRLIKEHR